MAKLIAKVVLLAAIVSTAYALCNTCSAQSSTACVTDTQFRICVNGIPMAPVIDCPTGTVCWSGAQVCAPEGTVPPACAHCGICNDAGAFACTGYNTFALCYGSNTPDNVSHSCADSFVCYIDAPQICIDQAVIGIGATCSPEIVSPTSTTTLAPVNPTTNPEAFCASLGRHGRHDISTDTTCKGYILCALVNSTWVGVLEQCPGNTFFNATLELCTDEKPLRCVNND